MKKQSVPEKREIFKTSKHKNRLVQSESNHVNRLHEFQKKEVIGIQSTLDLINEKIYSIRKRIDHTSEVCEKVRCYSINISSLTLCL